MFKVFGFYKFVQVKSLKKNKVFLQKFLISNHIRGTIIIAKEGLNGTISGKIKDINKTIKKLKSLFLFKQFDSSNKSKSKFQPFHKPKVKIKKEIVPMNLTINSKDRNMNILANTIIHISLGAIEYKICVKSYPTSKNRSTVPP